MKYILVISFIFLVPFIGASQLINYSEHLSGESPASYQGNKYIFLDFWATWCIPCIKSMDHIEYLQSLFGDKVFFISMSSEHAYAVKKFLKKRPLKTSTVLDFQGSTFQQFGIQAIPRSVLLDTQGDIVWSGHPSDMSPEKLRRLLPRHIIRGDLRFRHREAIQAKADKINYKPLLIPGFLFHTDTLYLASSPYNLQEKWIKSKVSTYYQGSFHSFLKSLLGIKDIQLELDKSLQRQIRIRIPTQLYEKKQDKIIQALMKHYNFQLDSTLVQREALLITCDSTTQFSSKDLLDFGNRRKLISSISIEADNMSCTEFAELMGTVLKKPVIFINAPSGIYDWNVQYKYKNLMFEQFKYDYNTEIEEKTINQVFYTTTPTKNTE